jgi:hypothetical protein
MKQTKTINITVSAAIATVDQIISDVNDAPGPDDGSPAPMFAD